MKDGRAEMLLGLSMGPSQVPRTPLQLQRAGSECPAERAGLAYGLGWHRNKTGCFRERSVSPVLPRPCCRQPHLEVAVHMGLP